MPGSHRACDTFVGSYASGASVWTMAFTSSRACLDWAYTSLAGILRQNSRFHAGMTSPVGAMYMALETAMSRRNETAVFIDDAQRREC